MAQRRFNGRELRLRRRAANLTQRDIGRRIHRCASTISLWERGIGIRRFRGPKADDLAGIAAILGCEIDDLYTTDEPDEPSEPAEGRL